MPNKGLEEVSNYSDRLAVEHLVLTETAFQYRVNFTDSLLLIIGGDRSEFGYHWVSESREPFAVMVVFFDARIQQVAEEEYHGDAELEECKDYNEEEATRFS